MQNLSSCSFWYITAPTWSEANAYSMEHTQWVWRPCPVLSRDLPVHPPYCLCKRICICDSDSRHQCYIHHPHQLGRLRYLQHFNCCCDQRSRQFNGILDRNDTRWQYVLVWMWLNLNTLFIICSNKVFDSRGHHMHPKTTDYGTLNADWTSIRLNSSIEILHLSYWQIIDS